MSSVRKFFAVALVALSGAAASAHTDAPRASTFQPKSVIASHEAAPALSAVAHHVRHRHAHRARHRAHPVRHVR